MEWFHLNNIRTNWRVGMSSYWTKKEKKVMKAALPLKEIEAYFSKVKIYESISLNFSTLLVAGCH